MDGLLTVTLTAADLIISALTAGISNSNTATPLYCPDVLRNETFDTEHSTDSIYKEDMKDLRERLDDIWRLQRTTLLTIR